MCRGPLHAPPLAGPAAVVGLRSDVLDPQDLEAGGLQGADRGLPARAGTLYEHLDLLQTVLQALASRRVGGHLGREGRRLAGALETGSAGGLPGDHVALAIRQRDDGVVERSLDVGLPDRNVLADTPAPALRSTRGGPLLLGRLLLAGDLHALGPLARAAVGLGVLAPHPPPAPAAQAAAGPH